MSSGTVEFAAAVVQRGARGLASLAAQDLVDWQHAHRDLGPCLAFSTWQSLLESHLAGLAGALAVGHPELFVTQVADSQVALAGRQVGTEIFRAGLDRLRGVLAQELPAQIAPLATDYVDQALSSLTQAAHGEPQRLVPDDPLTRLAAEYLLALLEGDRQRASRLILDAARGGQTVPDLYLRVLMPAQEELGRMWAADEINIAEEHFASATTRSVMAQLRMLADCQPGHGKTFLAAAVAGNHVDLGLQLVGDFFEMDGWRVIQLGADVPVADLAQAVEFYAADVVGLSVSQAAQLPALQESIAAIRGLRTPAQTKILVGGRALQAAPQAVRELGVDGYAADPRQAVALARSLVGL